MLYEVQLGNKMNERLQQTARIMLAQKYQELTDYHYKKYSVLSSEK